MADKGKHWKSKKSTLNFEEILADQVKQYPVVYNRSLSAFKDKQLRDSAWEDIAKAVGLGSGKRAETSFKRMRDRYTRLKKALEQSRRHGESLDNGRSRTTTDLESLKFMDWIYPHIYHRYSRQGSVKHPVTMVHEEDHMMSIVQDEYSEDAIKKEVPRSESEIVVISSEKSPVPIYDCHRLDDHTQPIVVDPRPQVDAVYECCPQSQSSNQHNTNLEVAESNRIIDSDDGDQRDIEFAEVPSKICDKMSNSRNQRMSEDDLFCSFVGSQLRLMNQQQKLMAKYQINNVLFQILMQDTSLNKTPSGNMNPCPQVCLQGCNDSCGLREPHHSFKNLPNGI